MPSYCIIAGSNNTSARSRLRPRRVRIEAKHVKRINFLLAVPLQRAGLTVAPVGIENAEPFGWRGRVSRGESCSAAFRADKVYDLPPLERSEGGRWGLGERHQLVAPCITVAGRLGPSEQAVPKAGVTFVA